MNHKEPSQAEQFAKTILWVLADVRASLEQHSHCAAQQISLQTKTPLDDVVKGMDKARSERRKAIYRKHVLAAKLEAPTPEEKANQEPELL